MTERGRRRLFARASRTRIASWKKFGEGLSSQACSVGLLAIAIGLVVNQLRADRLPLIGDWSPEGRLAKDMVITLDEARRFCDKVLHPEAFAKAVYNYQILPHDFVNATAIVLP